jgi:hypothetical protein
LNDKTKQQKDRDQFCLFSFCKDRRGNGVSCVCVCEGSRRERERQGFQSEEKQTEWFKKIQSQVLFCYFFSFLREEEFVLCSETTWFFRRYFPFQIETQTFFFCLVILSLMIYKFKLGWNELLLSLFLSSLFYCIIIFFFLKKKTTFPLYHIIGP